MRSNLDSFLQCTAPVIRSRFLPKSEIRNLTQLWHPSGKEKVECFTLADLWNCYDEWSAYGAGVPITLDDSDALVQYYVPYLSAIQIFTTRSAVQSLRDETDSETRDSSSDTSSDESESDKTSRWDGGSSEEGVLEHDGISQLSDKLGYLYFQYFETLTPYKRVPLMDKISGFARRYPGLMSLRNVDLSPASWLAVAWYIFFLNYYKTLLSIICDLVILDIMSVLFLTSCLFSLFRYPIYHIPTGRTIKDLSTCFLSYHTLSFSFQGTDLFAAVSSFLFVRFYISCLQAFNSSDITTNATQIWMKMMIWKSV
ncbi:hypothetical protein QQ045_027230 [Rhodiola kirilowii]